MYNLVSTSTYKVVDHGDDATLLAAKYDMRKHILIMADMPQIATRPAFVRPVKTHDVDYSFDKLSKSKKQSLLAHYKANELDKVRDIINKAKVAYICCQGQYPNMIEQIKQAIRNGIL